MQEFESLRVLNLRANKLNKLRLPLPHFPELRSIDVSENELPTWKEIMKFQYYPTLEEVNASSNPVADEIGDLRREILMFFPHYQKVNDEEVTEEDV
mmetsp:Transcript_20962/g.18295  ORF Transcript_20962/g.18295 Transcript_20962/m.18295 type:complete len:97 (+) Transcript_20962:349-639(+)